MNTTVNRPINYNLSTFTPTLTRGHAHVSLVCAAVLLATMRIAAAEDAADFTPTRADYEAAAALLPGNLQGLVKNESVTPHWVEGEPRFWYKRDGAAGPE